MSFVDRSNQIAITRVFKICVKRKWQKDYMEKIFLEAKILYNHLIDKIKNKESLPNNSEIYKVTDIEWISKDGEKYNIQLTHLSSHFKMGILHRILFTLKSLKQQRQNGRKTGTLKFKKTVNSIPLTTQAFRFVDEKHVTFQGMVKVFSKRGKRFYVHGTKQIKEIETIDPDYEFGDSMLIRKPDGYYLHIVFWVDREKYFQYQRSKQKFDVIAIDPGIKNSLTFSNGMTLKFKELHITKLIKRLQRKLARQKRESGKYMKTHNAMQRGYKRLSNIKKTIHNIIVSILRMYKTIIAQDETFSGWERLWGKQIGSTALGKFWEKLKGTFSNLVLVDRFVPTTKTCSNCGILLDGITLDTRVIKCSFCNFVINRDLNACFNMIKFVGLEQTEVTPVERESLLRKLQNVLKFVEVNFLDEAGSHTL